MSLFTVPILALPPHFSTPALQSVYVLHHRGTQPVNDRLQVPGDKNP